MCCAVAQVYDGHDGDEVSTMLADVLHGNVCDAPEFDSDPVTALMTGFQHTDDILVATHTPDTLKSGSTAVVVLLRRIPGQLTTLYCGNVGDSRCVCDPGRVSVANVPGFWSNTRVWKGREGGWARLSCAVEIQSFTRWCCDPDGRQPSFLPCLAHDHLQGRAQSQRHCSGAVL